MGTSHRQVFVKVNAPVDEGMAEVVRLLSRIPGLETVESCQGYSGEKAFVSFQLGGWKELSRLLSLLTSELFDPKEAVIVSARTANGSIPIGRITFRSAMTPRVERVLRRIARVYARTAG